jgi:hypothetical protein
MFLVLPIPSAFSLSSPAVTSTKTRGSAATPLTKQNIAVLGSGGYMGAMVFGYLQRAVSLYGTGLGRVRCLGATSDTAVRLNRLLSKHFCLAVADESVVKLTNMMDVESIQQRLQGYDALILGNDWTLTERPCTANTFEMSPNDKTWEVYWGSLKSSENVDDDDDDDDADKASLLQAQDRIKSEILDNILQAVKLAGIQHIVGVDSGTALTTDSSLLSRLIDSGVPYTCIQPVGQLINVPDYTYRKGVVGQLLVQAVQHDEENDFTTASSSLQLAKEDVAAMCVQSLQSLDWTTSRTLQVSCSGSLQVLQPVSKRPDQEWCVESRQLEAALTGIQ